MFSPRQRASFIDSKMVSIVASACFCVIPRLVTRMLIKSDLSIRSLPKAPTPRNQGFSSVRPPVQTIAEQRPVASQLTNTPTDFTQCQRSRAAKAAVHPGMRSGAFGFCMDRLGRGAGASVERCVRRGAMCSFELGTLESAPIDVKLLPMVVLLRPHLNRLVEAIHQVAQLLALFPLE